MPPRKVVEVDPTSLAASRSRRPNAGVPSRAFDEVSERFERRAKKAEQHAKATAAEEIQADPLTGDDTLAREPLLEFNPPTPTGNDLVDQTNYDQARTKYLVHYLAVRDGLDVRSAIHSEKIGLAELEEIFLDPDAADGLLSDKDEPSHGPNSGGKGKQKVAVAGNDATSDQSGGKRPFEQGQDGPRKSPRGADTLKQTRGVEAGGPQQLDAHRETTPLRRTDSTLYIDGRPIDRPVYFSRDRIPRVPGATALLTGKPRPAQANSSTKTPSHAANHARIPMDKASGQGPSARARALGNPSPLGGQPADKPCHTATRDVPRVSHDKQQLNNGLTLPCPSDTTTTGAATHRHHTTTGAATHRHHNVPHEPASRLGPERNRCQDQSRQPAQQPQRLIPVQKKPSNPVQHAAPCNPRSKSPSLPAESDIDREEWSEEEAEPVPATNSTGKSRQRSGRATIRSFLEEEQPIVREMARLARARTIVNGTYDDTEATLYTPYEAWPDTWQQRETREMVVAQCLTAACEEFNLCLRFQPRHVKCACDRVKACVDRCFGFTIGQSQRNINLCKVLLPFNFHYKDVVKKSGPFENTFMLEACKAVAFEKQTSVGARYPGHFVNMPATYIAYVCALAHHVIFSYRTGEYESKKLSVPVQRSAFRRALQFQITMEEKKRTTSGNIRKKIFDYCMHGLKEKPEVRHSSPEPEREWTPDEDEVYVSHYAGDGGDRADVDGGEEVGAVDEDEHAGLEAINWEDELAGQDDIYFEGPVAGPSGTYHDEDVEMENGENVDELAEDQDDRCD
ncbi:hypothetical protein FRC10_002159 [Ceratobasidium sp. 414]|nr:hypothetical protein FRC10_002159 [Ceratobasidium sp. 414]